MEGIDSKGIIFIYRSNKYRTNLRKHGIDFERVKMLFYLPEDQICICHDEAHSEYEKRFLIVGFVPDYNRYVRVNYTITKEVKTRLITALKVKRSELGKYFRKNRSV